jgi:hypothetical protein
MKTWRFAAGAVMVASLASSQGVKHAPTLQSCVADINLWSSQIPGFPESGLDQIRTGMKSLTMKEIDGRVSSLGECVNSYPMLGKPQAGDLPAIITLLSFYDSEKELRYINFLHRHELLGKLKEEDAAGLR